MNALKKAGKVLLWIVGIVVALVATLPLWIGPVVRTAANAIVPKKTGTSFGLGVFGLNPYSGKLTVGDVQLWNPEGFDQKMAATLGTFDVSVDMLSLTDDTIVVKDVVLKDVFVSYVSNGKGDNNFDIIKRNANGGEEAKAAEEMPEDSASVETVRGDASSRKIIIDHLLVQNVLVQIGPISMPLPGIELNGIGRKTNGTTMAEAWNEIYAATLRMLSSAGANLNELISGIGNEGVKRALQGAEASKRVLNSATEAVGNVGKATGEGVDKSVKKINENVEKATEKIKALKSLF